MSGEEKGDERVERRRGDGTVWSVLASGGVYGKTLGGYGTCLHHPWRSMEVSGKSLRGKGLQEVSEGSWIQKVMPVSAKMPKSSQKL